MCLAKRAHRAAPADVREKGAGEEDDADEKDADSPPLDPQSSKPDKQPEGVSTARPFGPIHAELFEEADAEAFPNGGIKYFVDLPDEWSIRTPPGPLRVVGRDARDCGGGETQVGRKSGRARATARAQLPHKDDCKATRWSKNDYKKQHTLDERLRFVAEDRIREGNQ